MKRIISILFFSILFCCGAVLGQNPYTIYPVPQEQVQLKGNVSFTPVVSVVAEEGIDGHTRERAAQILKEKGLEPRFVTKPGNGQAVIYLGIDGSSGVADRKANALKLKRDVFAKEKYDRHIVSLNSRGGKVAQVVILGENTDAVFYGLATLEQMLDEGTTNLSCTVFYDYADVQYRGVIEGYYGVPYSMEVTQDLFRFMARYKLNMYMYGAKSDPYHTRYWDEAYPVKISEREKRYGLLTQDMMKQLTQTAHECKVNFIWAIHPGQTFTALGESDVLERIMHKFELMYDLGVRQFGVFVDDCGVPYDDPSLKQCADRLSGLQQMIDTKWNTPGTPAEQMVKQLQYVPQLYAYSWAKPDMARKFWESLNPVPDKVNIYTTGKNVWSVPNSTDLGVLNDYLGREVSWWWNYPCNDVDVTKIFVADTYTNFADETHIHFDGELEKELSVKTVIVNPMQQGELSKIPLFGVADYTWNMDSFNNMENWKASLPAILGDEVAASFETIVPYLRYYDSLSPLAGLIDDFKLSYSKEGAKASAGALKGELSRIVRACEVIGKMENSGCKSDSLFYADIRPWLKKVKAMAENAGIMVDALLAEELLEMTPVKFAKSWSAIEGIDKNDEHRFDILRGMGTDITLSVQTAEPAAHSLRPFLDWLLVELEGKYGLGREYKVYLPKGLKPGAPLVFVLHGYGATIDQLQDKGFNEAADKYGFAVCYPQGTKDGRGNPCWNVGYPFQEDMEVDDVSYLCQLAEKLQKEYNLSKERTFCTGMSNGGEMCYLMAYCGQTTFKAVAPIAGLTMAWMPEKYRVTKPIPLFEIHGTEDRVSEWNGDMEDKGGWGPYLPVPDAVEYWVKRNGCTKEAVKELPLKEPDGHKVIARKFTGDKNSPQVWLYEVVGGVHSWFNEDMDTAGEIWRFFSLVK